LNKTGLTAILKTPEQYCLHSPNPFPEKPTASSAFHHSFTFTIGVHSNGTVPSQTAIK